MRKRGGVGRLDRPARAEPRKGVTHTREDVAAELADAAFTALVAIESLGLDAQTVLNACAAKVRSRLAD
ncbi:hypothetical protein NKG94_12935 [Micromonospora sp. M12]